MLNVNAEAGQAFDRVHDIQEAYRALLDALARPGKVNLLEAARKLDGLSREEAMITCFAQMLLDNEVSFAVEMEGFDGVEQRIKRQTFSRPQPVEEAGYLFVSGSDRAEHINRIAAAWNRGTLVQPEDGATVFVLVEGFGEEEGASSLSLSGPGINGERKLFVKGLASEWLEVRRIANAEYPLGIDMVLYAADGRIAALPRTTIIKGVMG